MERSHANVWASDMLNEKHSHGDERPLPAEPCALASGDLGWKPLCTSQQWGLGSFGSLSEPPFSHV